MSGANRDDFLERARAMGMDVGDALLFADLARHAARKAFESIEIVAATVPSPMLQMQIKVNACNMLQLCMFESLDRLGPVGRLIRAQIEAHNLSVTQEAGAPAAADAPTQVAPVPAGAPTTGESP